MKVRLRSISAAIDRSAGFPSPMAAPGVLSTLAGKVTSMGGWTVLENITTCRPPWRSWNPRLDYRPLTFWVPLPSLWSYLCFDLLERRPFPLYLSPPPPSSPSSLTGTGSMADNWTKVLPNPQPPCPRVNCTIFPLLENAFKTQVVVLGTAPPNTLLSPRWRTTGDQESCLSHDLPQLGPELVLSKCVLKEHSPCHMKWALGQNLGVLWSQHVCCAIWNNTPVHLCLSFPEYMREAGSGPRWGLMVLDRLQTTWKTTVTEHVLNPM